VCGNLLVGLWVLVDVRRMRLWYWLFLVCDRLLVIGL